MQIRKESLLPFARHARRGLGAIGMLQAKTVT